RANTSLRETMQRAVRLNFSLGHAFRNPLLLTLACFTAEERRITGDTTRGELMDRSLRSLAARVWKETPLRNNDPYPNQLVGLLRRLAWELFKQWPESYRFGRKPVIDNIQQIITATELANWPVPPEHRPLRSENRLPLYV